MEDPLKHFTTSCMWLVEGTNFHSPRTWAYLMILDAVERGRDGNDLINLICEQVEIEE